MNQKQDSTPNFTKSKVEKIKGQNANQSFSGKKKKVLKNTSFEVMDSIVKTPFVKSQEGITGDSLNGRSQEKKRKKGKGPDEKGPEEVESTWDVLSNVVKAEISRLENLENAAKSKKQAGEQKKRKRDKDELNMSNAGGNINQTFGSNNKMGKKHLSTNQDQPNPNKLSKRARRSLNKKKSLEKKDKDDLNYIPLVTKTLGQSISELSPSKSRDKSFSKSSSAKEFTISEKDSQKERSIFSSMSEDSDESEEDNEVVTKKVNKLNKPSNVQKNKQTKKSANILQNIPKSDSDNDDSVEEAESSDDENSDEKDDEESEEENINTQIQSGNLQKKFLNQKGGDSSDVEDESDDDDESDDEDELAHMNEKNQPKQFAKKNTSSIQSMKKSAMKQNGKAVLQKGKQDSDEEESDVEAEDFLDDEAEEGDETEEEDESDNEIEDPSESPSKKFKSSPASDNTKRFDVEEVVNKIFISNLPKE